MDVLLMNTNSNSKNWMVNLTGNTDKKSKNAQTLQQPDEKEAKQFWGEI